MHLWHPAQTTPGDRVGGRIDALMGQQAAALDVAERQRLFADVQQTLAEHVPALSFASPHVFVGHERPRDRRAARPRNGRSCCGTWTRSPSRRADAADR